MTETKIYKSKLDTSNFSQKLKRSLNELKDKNILLTPVKTESNIGKNWFNDDDKNIETQSNKPEINIEDQDIIEKKFENVDGIYESPTKKHKTTSRLAGDLESDKLKRTLSFSSDKSTSDDDDKELLKTNIDLATLSSQSLIETNRENKEKSPLELDCKDEFIKRCNFFNLDDEEKEDNELSNVDSVANIIKSKPLLKNQGVLINLNEISSQKTNKEDNGNILSLQKEGIIDDEEDNLQKHPEKEMGADLLLYLASSPSSSQKNKKPHKNFPSNKNYSLNIPSSQSALLNRNNPLVNDNNKNKRKDNDNKTSNSNEINKSAPSALLDYDGNTMLTSHMTNNGSNNNNNNNNISLQYSSVSGRNGNINNNKYKLLSTPVSKTKDIFGQDSSILRYATMSGGSVMNSAINTHYNDIPDVVLLNSRIDLSEKINDLSNIDDKSRVIDDDISLKGLDETSDEENEKEVNNNINENEKNDYDSEFDKNKLFKTPNISNSGVMSHMHNSMIDSVMLNNVSDAIHFGSKTGSS
ncbi:hypothetical protein HANVADRAFT_51679, partial [Hanseniaspora valbyensis NRRL Y-1626]